jgi:mannosyltransferase
MSGFSGQAGPHSEPRLTQRRHRPVRRAELAVPFGLTLLLGAAGITRQAWRDEHATWWASTISFDDFLKLVSHVDIVLAPYYLFMRLWIGVAGDSVVMMRLPSLLAMATAACLTAVLGTRLYTKEVGLAAGCLLAVIPSVSRYAEEARPYAFVMCFAVASVLAVLSKRWALAGLFVLLTGLGHLVALLVLLAHLPLVKDWKRWSIAVGCALIALMPLVVLGLRQTGQVAWIDAGVKQLVMLPQSLTRSAATAGILAALALLAVIGMSFDRATVALLVWALAPPLVLFVLARDLFYYRYLLFTLPAWTLLAASAIRLLAIQRQKLAVPVLCLAVLALGIRDHIGLRKSPLPGDQDYQSAAAYVTAHANTDDLVLFDGYPDQRERFGFAYEWRRQTTAPHLCASLQTCAAPRIWLIRPATTAVNAAPLTTTVTSPPIATAPPQGAPVPPSTADVPPGFAAAVTQSFAGLAVTLLVPAR